MFLSGCSWPLHTVHSISTSREPPLPVWRTVAAMICWPRGPSGNSSIFDGFAGIVTYAN